MKTLFPPSFNWFVFLGIALVIRVLFVSMSWLSFFALILALHQFMLLFMAVCTVIPIRYMLGAFMVLQYFVGPSFAYNGLDQYAYHIYRMKISEDDYFAYVIPAVLSFIYGLHINAGNLKGEVINENAVIKFVNNNKMLPYYFIAIGFLSSVLAGFFPSTLALVFYLLGSFKFIGLFFIVIGGVQIKIFPLIIVLSSIVLSSLGEGMFHDLITWILFVGTVYGVKYKFSTPIKLIGASVFIILAVLLQQLKSGYRDATWTGSEERGVSTFANVFEKETENKNIFSFENLADKNVRINQGFIVTNVMNTVPNRVPFADGDEMILILEAAFLPRFLAPNKLQAGDRKIFTKYSGINLRKGTSMGLGSLSDAYINFGIFGGCIFMFILGWVYSWLLNLFYKKSFEFPVLLLFTPLVFYYPIRPDCELQTAFGHFVKSCMLIFAMLFLFKDIFRAAPEDRKPSTS